MKEIVVRLDDKIADYLSLDASAAGLSSEELIKYILGRYVQADIRTTNPQRGIAIPVSISGILNTLGKYIKSMSKDTLKKMAEDGALSCKNCTIKLKPEDIDNEKCGSCGAPLKDALGGLME